MSINQQIKHGLNKVVCVIVHLEIMSGHIPNRITNLTALVEYALVILHQRELWFLLECLGIVQSYNLVIVLYQWDAKFERPALQFFMSNIACGSNMHLKILRR